MTEYNTTHRNADISMFLLFLVFLVLKLNPGGNLDTPIAGWSWWWVTAPLWGPVVIAVVVLVVLFVFYSVKGSKR